MAMIVLLGGKGAPGATTSAAVLASVWPRSVILADLDPAGGDVAAGWLGQWLVDGWVRADRGVLGFATATRHLPTATLDMLGDHLQVAPPAPHVRLLAGLQNPAQATAIGDPGWRHLAQALTGHDETDVLVDAGRFSDQAPWPLLTAADLVLLIVRPHSRHLLAARSALEVLRARLARGRLGVGVCATTAAGSREVGRVLGAQVGLELPDDPRAAAIFSDGADAGEVPARSALVRTARRAAHRLHAAFHPADATSAVPAPREPRAPVPAPVGGEIR
ncbi:hypothetical protein [Amycolatopsis sp. NPDC059657]|uniref:hypothetical protein n=1 Tax=Amycolatopsis sp. NPDC059657 TaxID=3346899 RepID=UPI00366B3F7D